MPSRPLVIAVVACTAVLPASFTLYAGFDPDAWWHLRVGQLVSEGGTVPETDPFSRLGREEPRPWVAYSWLFELALFKAFESFGEAGVLWARLVLVAASTAAVFALIVGRRPADWWTLAALGLAAVTLMPLARERPWHLTIAFTCVTASVVNALRDGTPVRRFAWLPLIFVLWANVHIQFVLGWLVLGLASVFPARANRQHVVALTAGCVAAVCINPYHVRLFVVIWEYATQTGPLRTVQELAPPDLLSPWFVAGAGLIVLGAVQVIRQRPVDWFAVAMLIVALVFMLRMRRDVWLAAVAAAAALRTASDLHVSWRWPFGVIGIVASVFLAVRCANLAELGPSTDTTAVNASRYPVRAVESVRENRLPGPLFNSFDWGGYLIWALPEHPVSIDGRTNLYGSEQVERAMRTWAAEPGWQDDPDLQTARLVIAPVGTGLAVQLRERPDEWQIVFEDATAIVARRRE